MAGFIPQSGVPVGWPTPPLLDVKDESLTPAIDALRERARSMANRLVTDNSTPLPSAGIGDVVKLIASQADVLCGISNQLFEDLEGHLDNRPRESSGPRFAPLAPATSSAAEAMVVAGRLAEAIERFIELRESLRL